MHTGDQLQVLRHSAGVAARAVCLLMMFRYAQSRSAAVLPVATGNTAAMFRADVICQRNLSGDAVRVQTVGPGIESRRRSGRSSSLASAIALFQHSMPDSLLSM